MSLIYAERPHVLGVVYERPQNNLVFHFIILGSKQTFYDEKRETRGRGNREADMEEGSMRCLCYITRGTCAFLIYYMLSRTIHYTSKRLQDTSSQFIYLFCFIIFGLWFFLLVHEPL